MIILDTSACVDYLNGNKEIKKSISKQEELIHITSITVYEINIGLERTKRKLSIKRYNELYKIWTEFISRIFKKLKKHYQIHTIKKIYLFICQAPYFLIKHQH